MDLEFFWFSFCIFVTFASTTFFFLVYSVGTSCVKLMCVKRGLRVF